VTGLPVVLSCLGYSCLQCVMDPLVLHSEPRSSSQKTVLIDEKAEVHTAVMELAVWVHNENSNLP
jgi:hypothetical protein